MERLGIDLKRVRLRSTWNTAAVSVKRAIPGKCKSRRLQKYLS
jgi:hypothetical protein